MSTDIDNIIRQAEIDRARTIRALAQRFFRRFAALGRLSHS